MMQQSNFWMYCHLPEVGQQRKRVTDVDCDHFPRVVHRLRYTQQQHRYMHNEIDIAVVTNL